MHDLFSLVSSDSHGNPIAANWNSLHKHWVLCTDNPHPSLVAQMLARGQWPNDDCGPANWLSRLRSDGHNSSMPNLETLCGTDKEVVGTTKEGMYACGRALGYSVDYYFAVPPAMNVHNPAWGGFITAAASGPYRDASLATCVVVKTLGVWEQPPPIILTSMEVDMATDPLTRPFRLANGGLVVYELDPTTGIVLAYVEGANGGPPYNEVAVPGKWDAILSGGTNPNTGNTFFHGRATDAAGNHGVFGTEFGGSGWTNPARLF